MTHYLGQQLGSYHLTRLLGEGGFAEVYLGEHVHLNTLAAVKVLQTRLAAEELESFLNEARIIAHLEHPHIIRVLDYGTENDIPYLVMSYAPNGTLRRRHPRGVRLPVATVVGYAGEVADALQYAHDERVIHRDIKPENMLVGRRNEILLSDFGIAVVAHSSRSQNLQEAIGTAAYIAPEQLQGWPSPNSDQYALGVVVYEWLCGELPFHGSFAELCSQHMHVPPAPLHMKVSDMPPAVEEAVLKALSKSPQQRFPSIRMFAEALQQAEQTKRIFYMTTSLQPLQPSLSAPGQPLSRGLQAAPQPQIAPNSPLQATPFPWPTPPLPVSPAFSPAALPPAREKQVSRASTLPRDHRISRRKLLGCVVGVGVVGMTGIGAYANRNALTSWATQTLHSYFAAFTYRGHSDVVNAIAWSPNGKRVASASDDQTVQVWDALTGNHVFTYRGHADQVKAVAWSPNGQYIASGSIGVDNTIHIWDAARVTHLFTYNGHSASIRSLTWSPDSKLIASASVDTTVQVWEAGSGRRIVTYSRHAGVVNAVFWSPNGKYIASASNDTTVQVWHAITGELLLRYTGHPKFVNSVAWSPNSRSIASGGMDTTVQVWDPFTQQSLYAYPGHVSAIRAVAWSRDGTRIASGSGDSTNFNAVTNGNGDHTLQVWNAASGSNAFIFRGHWDSVLTVAWSPTSTYVASGSQDHSVQLWQIT